MQVQISTIKKISKGFEQLFAKNGLQTLLKNQKQFKKALRQQICVQLVHASLV